MAKTAYQPPRQGIVGMVVDSLLMLVLVFCALKAPAWVAEWRTLHQPVAAEDSAAPTRAAKAVAPKVTWEQLGQNAAMQEGWEKLGKDPAAAKAIIDNRFDYTVNLLQLLFVAALLV
ncbi:MAG: hypothetical protein H0V34_04500, partial [Gammaproteobacteria bacterium]|nr:hypothetical protein [Gammaproteobacteria bacterium]